ncbi:AbrB/MazE/SpoVT family DNA-binding domain-containing protein [Candidatus Saccharibacteria bacterium]|nr:AbrB/MazE/SpoVT family DNA-binding domain-containing protein [Candidatus Saccharibacteria bacterium]
MMYTNSITPKGQVTIPKALRDKIGLKPGQSARFELLDERTIVIRKPLTDEQVRRVVGPPRGDQPLTDKEKARLKARGLL